MKSFKHKHGNPNNIFTQEEKSMLAEVTRILSSTPNSQTIGRIGELLLLKFLKRYLPSTLNAVSGHFITPLGEISPQIDIMILDSRYPLLSKNADGSVLAMLHSLLWTIEVKTNLRSADIKKSWKDSVIINGLAQELTGEDKCGDSFYVDTNLIAYHCAQKLDTIEDIYVKSGTPSTGDLDIYILRFPKQETTVNHEFGGLLHFEPLFDDSKTNPIDSYSPCFSASYTPLSDFFYRLVQNCYYSLGYRDFSFSQIGAHFMDYMSWSSASWEKVYKD